MTTFMYSLEQFANITFNGFNFNLPDDTIDIISKLSLEVGSPSYIKTPVFQKRVYDATSSSSKNNPLQLLQGAKNKMKNKDKTEEWETLRSFQPTKIEQKSGVQQQMDTLRSYLNKMTDVNYEDVKNKINVFIDESIAKEDMLFVSRCIFEIASSNRFYSKMYADLYAGLIEKHEIMKEVFMNSFDSFMDLFKTIKYTDADENYDEFCKNNKDNEKRRALSTFFVNLTGKNIITGEQLTKIIHDLLSDVFVFMNMENKKNEVDELSENIVILCADKILEKSCFPELLIDQMSMIDFIHKLSTSKAKSYTSLSIKTIFKYLDMVESR